MSLLIVYHTESRSESQLQELHSLLRKFTGKLEPIEAHGASFPQSRRLMRFRAFLPVLRRHTNKVVVLLSHGKCSGQDGYDRP